jgi:uncharacterized repeat protein (TIGR01451 family)/uncharacterized repeat protein (TIGR02543 family)
MADTILNQHTLTVNTSGTGTGTVDGGGTYDHGTTQQVSATANPGSTFTGWGGDCMGTATPVDVLIDSDKTCTATFTLNQPAIAVSVTPDVTSAEVGEEITYSYHVTNTGNVTLDPVVAGDTFGSVVLDSSSLAPGAEATGSTSYTVFESDLPGPLTNTVVVTGTPGVGSVVTDTASVSVMLTSKPTLAVSITESDGSTTVGEDGSHDSYTVVLDTAPSDSVQIAVSSDDEEQATVDKATLTFATDDWDTPQTVTVTGVDDDVDDGDIEVTISHSASGGGYDGVSIDSVSVTVTDDDTAGVSLSKSSLTVSEIGSTDTYTVVLDSEPTQPVTITATSLDTGEATVSPDTLTFTDADWNIAQEVTVTGINDDVADGTQTTIITHTVSSDDISYDTLNDKGVEVTVTDDDTAGVSLSKSSLTVSEVGSTGTYEVVLTSQPTATVTIAVTSSDEGEATVSPDTLTFTASDWDTAQTVTVTGVDDTDIDGTQSVTITHAASSADSAYDTLDTKEVTITVADDDSDEPTDTTPPGAPEITSPALTNSPTPTISGTAEAGVTITLTIDLGGETVTYETTADGDGNWSIDLATDTPTDGALPEGGLAPGEYPVTVTATDAAGNVSDVMTFTMTITSGNTTLYLPLIAR